MDLDKSQKDPIACLQSRSSIPEYSTAINHLNKQQQPTSFPTPSNSNNTNFTSIDIEEAISIYERSNCPQNNQNSTPMPRASAMDSFYTTYDPSTAVMAGPNAFGDDEDFSNYDASLLLGTLTNEPLPFLADDGMFPMPMDLANTTTLGTPPLSGFDGYLAGNLDFDENLFNVEGHAWGAEMYNQDFMATGMDSFTNQVPAPPSTASDSQGFSPVGSMGLPFTPSEVYISTPSAMPSPSSAATNPSPLATDRQSSASFGPKYVPNSDPSSFNEPGANLSSSTTRRQLRKLIKPETCPVCGKGHAQIRERDRHIVTQHYDEAVRMGLNIDRPQCHLCDQTFRRKDHLTRHMKRRHGY